MSTPLHVLNDDDLLQAQCEACDAWCCVLLHVDDDHHQVLTSAGERCGHLRGAACGVYDARLQRGYSACLSFDCHGAGQRLSQLVRAGDVDDVENAFWTLRQLHRWRRELRALRVVLDDETELLHFAQKLRSAGPDADLIHLGRERDALVQKAMQELRDRQPVAQRRPRLPMHSPLHMRDE